MVDVFDNVTSTHSNQSKWKINVSKKVEMIPLSLSHFPRRLFKLFNFMDLCASPKNSLDHLLNSFLLATNEMPQAAHELFSKQWQNGPIA